MKNIYSILIMLVLQSVTLYSQEETVDTIDVELHKVLAIYERSNEKVEIRWVPSTPDLWLMGNRAGYVISRAEYDTSQVFNPQTFTILDTLKVKSKSEWVEDLQARDSIPMMLAGAYECIYGEYKSLKDAKGFSGWLDQSGELYNKYSFAIYIADVDKEASQYSALRYTDESIESDKNYIYKIDPIHDGLKEMVTQPGIAIVEKNTVYESPYIKAEQRDGYITLKWPKGQQNAEYSAYFIERSIEGELFNRLSDIPYISGTSRDGAFVTDDYIYVDTIQNYMKVKYRIQGLTPFGGVSPYSSEIATFAIDLTPPPPPEYLDVQYLGGSNMMIKWEQSAAADLAGYRLFRGHSVKDNYYSLTEEILPPEGNRYLDTTAYQLTENYYVLLTVDTAGNYSQSHPELGVMIDTFPPEIPTGLKGEVDSSGVVTLTWDPSKEIDIRGYKIYFANADYHEYSLLTGQSIRDTIFTDTVTLNTLTEELYYKIMAVDKRYNYSFLSESIKLNRPDTIPPNAPIFTSYKVEEDHIYLEWENSDSKDVIAHVLLRKSESDSDFIVIDSLKNFEKSYSDRILIPNTTYRYILRATDDANLSTDSPFEMILKAPKKWTVQIEEQLTIIEEGDKQLLSWKWPNKLDPVAVKLYRSIANEGFELLEVIHDESISTYFDSYVKEDVNYKYAIKFKFADRSHSSFSNIINHRL